MVRGTVRAWHEELGWGVIDSPDTPGGCWAHFSTIDTAVRERRDGLIVSDYQVLRPGDAVDLEWEPADQDGFAFRAVAVAARR
jgi:CspA family cold shock protein